MTTTLFSFALLVALAQSPPPGQLQFQARLTNASGAPITTSVSVQVRIYDVPVGGSALWSETSAVTPLDGVATLPLGAVTPIPANLFDGGTRFLAIQVGGDPEMTPRRAIVAVPFAARAAKAAALDANAAIPSGIVTTTQVLDGTIGAADLADASVTSAKLASGAITSPSLAPDSVTANAIATGAVGSAEIADHSIALVDLQSVLQASTSGQAFTVLNVGAGGTSIYGWTLGTGPTMGVWGRAELGTGGASGVYGEAFGTSQSVYGVHGFCDSAFGAGVYGHNAATSLGGVGVVGDAVSPDGVGVRGVGGSNGIGVWGECVGASAKGVYGRATSPTGANFGVYGRSESTTGTGVLGIGMDPNGVNYGVRGNTLSPSGYGVYCQGKFASTGTKAFIQPHPSDASKEIHFVCLEGNESGTYFRGTSRAEGGVAVIDVPEAFRLVTAKEGLTVQLTPIGKLASLCVESIDLERIVVRGSVDVKFSYFVNGVRRGFGGHEAFHENRSFVPSERGVPFGTQYPEELRRVLVENGILNPDFTPNEQTAARLGWSLREPDAAEAPAQASTAISHANEKEGAR